MVGISYKYLDIVSYAPEHLNEIVIGLDQRFWIRTQFWTCNNVTFFFRKSFIVYCDPTRLKRLVSAVACRWYNLLTKFLPHESGKRTQTCEI